MTKTNVDLDAYKGRLRMDSTSGVLLGIRLIKAAPKRRSARLSRALEEVRAATVNAQKVRQERSRLRPENLRPYDKKVDDGWGGLYGVLSGQARFVGEPIAAIAQRIIALLFAEGTEFLTINYDSEWLHGETLLARIADEKLAADIDTVAGKHALAYIRGAQKELGDALGVGDVELERASTTAMAEALDALSRAVAKYVRVLAGETDEDDEKSVGRFARAVAPIDRHREYHAVTRTSASEEDTTTTTDAADGEDDPNAPVPPVEADPAPES